MNDTTASDKPAPSLSDQSLESVQTESLGPLLAELGCSLLVSTYQAGKLINVFHEGGRATTYYNNARKPMGIAVGPGQIAVGQVGEIVFYSDVPGNCAKLDPPGVNDACFVPRYRHLTGDIDIHEMVFGKDGQPWFINTRFSALCTLDGMTSFAPVWRPPFVSTLEPEDRCHLNGLALVNGMPRFVTGLGESDRRGGWRDHKADGGFLMDVSSNRFVCRGLSMPHSPRWHAGSLWVCESGRGTLSRVSLATGELGVVHEFPGFTRGLDFCGPYAFVGLSQIRESATFSGIPITERAAERNCGVWIVDLRDGSLAGILRFTQGVHEIFSVQVLPGVRNPRILEQFDKLALDTYFLPAQVLQPKHPSV